MEGIGGRGGSRAAAAASAAGFGPVQVGREEGRERERVERERSSFKVAGAELLGFIGHVTVTTPSILHTSRNTLFLSKTRG